MPKSIDSEKRRFLRKNDTGRSRVPSVNFPDQIAPVGKQRIVEARLIGLHKETDLALIKIDQTQNWGVVIDDVTPGGPAEAAGLKIGDIVVSADGRLIGTLPAFIAALYLHSSEVTRETLGHAI